MEKSEEIIEDLYVVMRDLEKGKNEEWDLYHDENWDNLIYYVQKAIKHLQRGKR